LRPSACLWLALAAALASPGCRGRETSTNQPAASQGETRSCYEISGLGIQPPEARRAIFVLVDQTTGLSERLRTTLRRSVERLLVPGATYGVFTFSAYTSDHFVTEASSGALEAPVPDSDRRSLSVRGLERLDHCLARQRSDVLTKAASELDQATGVSASTFSRSEIMASLSQLSAAVRASHATDRYVIVVSDLLEHSSTTSFYANRNLRLIDPAAEMQRAAANRLIGDFSDARLAVIGAGLLPPDSAPDAGRDAQRLDALKRFWEQWFRQSHADLIAYGQPDLVAPIQ
jgi:hypothetical protein